MAALQYMATGGSEAGYADADESGACQHALRRWSFEAGCHEGFDFPAPDFGDGCEYRKDRCAGHFYLRSDAADSELWRECLLRGEFNSWHRRRSRSAQDGGAA